MRAQGPRTSHADNGGPAELSRRSMLAGASAAPLATCRGPLSSTSDPSIEVCPRWLAIGAEQRRLQLERGTFEGWLMTKRSWYQLSPDQLAANPEGPRLAEIDARLDVLEVEGHALLKAMRPKPAKSVESVVANLAVGAHLIFVEDQPETHGLINRAVRDLAAFSGDK